MLFPTSVQDLQDGVCMVFEDDLSWFSGRVHLLDATKSQAIILL